MGAYAFLSSRLSHLLTWILFLLDPSDSFAIEVACYLSLQQTPFRSSLVMIYPLSVKIHCNEVAFCRWYYFSGTHLHSI
jgi:hypothetical protein